jgi:hypothetical protein
MYDYTRIYIGYIYIYIYIYIYRRIYRIDIEMKENINYNIVRKKIIQS